MVALAPAAAVGAVKTTVPVEALEPPVVQVSVWPTALLKVGEPVVVALAAVLALAVKLTVWLVTLPPAPVL